MVSVPHEAFSKVEGVWMCGYVEKGGGAEDSRWTREGVAWSCEAQALRVR